MLSYVCCLCVVLSIANGCLGAEHALVQDVDRLIQDELGDDPFSRRVTAEDFKKIDELIKTNGYNATKQQNTTKGNHTEEKFNKTQILFNIKKREINYLINMTTNRLEEFKNNVDVFEELFQKAKQHEPTVNGRRASDSNNMLLETMLVDAEDAMRQLALPPPSQTKDQKPNLRWYFYDTIMYSIPYEVHVMMGKKVINMMYTHVYRTQYYVTLAQVLRKRYVHNARYKLGFCFALARQLYAEQRALLNSIVYIFYNHFRYHGLMTSWTLFIYEKLQRLQRDIRDVIHHIRALEYERKMTEEPDYYEYHPSSTGRYSG